MLKSINFNIALSALLIMSQIVLLPIMASTFGAANYGKFMIYKSISHQGIIALLAFGINVVLRRDFAALNIKKASIYDLSIIMKLSIFVTPILIILAIFLPNEYSVELYIIFGILFIEVILVYLTSILEGLKKITLIRFCDLLYTFILILGVSIVKIDFFYCLLSIYLFNCVRLLIYLFTSLNFGPKQFLCDWRDIRVSAKYLGLANTFSILNNNFEKYLVTAFVGLEAILYLDIFQKISKLFKNQIGIFTTLIQPYYQKIRVEARDYAVLTKLQNSFFFVNVTLVVLSFYYSPWLLLIWMGEEFIFLSSYINFSIIALSLYFLNSFIGMTLVLSKEYSVSLRIQVIITTIRIIFTSIALPLIGLWSIVMNVYILGLVVWLVKPGIPKLVLIRTTILMLCIFFVLDKFYFSELHNYALVRPEETMILFSILAAVCFYSIFKFMRNANVLLSEG